MTSTKSYSVLRTLRTFEERFEYLKLGGGVGLETFGHDRWMNQRFYTSPEWRSIRQHVILRDHGCDLGIPGYEIQEGLLIHHINPMVAADIEHGETWILDPEFLITTTHMTHNAIHFGDRSLLPRVVLARQPGDTKLW